VLKPFIFIVWTKDSAPQDWALTQMNLGNALQVRVTGDMCCNMEGAITCYRSAFQARTRGAAPLDWATTQVNLGNVLQSRISGDKLSNMEDSIACYRCALEVRTKDAAPLDWASAQLNLGVALGSRIAGEKSANVEDSIVCYRAALKVWTKDTAPLDWAKTQMNLGVALGNRIAGNKAANMEDSIMCYRAALEVWTKDGAPLDWANSQMNLGVALGNRVSGNKSANKEATLACYRNALKIWTKDSAPLDWAMVCCNLSCGLLAHATRDGSTNEDASGLADESLVQVEAALTVFSPEILPLRYLDACRQRVLVLARLNKPQEAVEAVDVAMKARENAQSLSASGSLHSRSISEDSGSLGGIHVALRLHLGGPGPGLEAAEASRAALLYSMISQGVDVKSCLSSSDVSAFDDANNLLRITMHQLDRAAGKGDCYGSLLADYAVAKKAVDSFVHKARMQKLTLYGDCQLGATLNVREITSFLRDAEAMAVVFFFAPIYENLAGGDEQNFLHALAVCNGDTHVHVNRDICDPGIGEAADMFLNSSGESKDVQALRTSAEAEYLAVFGSFVTEILHAVGKGSVPERLIIVPHRGLHKVPFSAIPINVRSNDSACCSISLSAADDGTSLLLGDLITGGMWTAPSLSIAAKLRGNVTRTGNIYSSSIATVTCPEVQASSQLQDVVRHRRMDLNAVCPNVIDGEDATPEIVKDCRNVRGCDILHLNCHGTFSAGGGSLAASLNPSKVLELSGLRFEGKAVPGVKSNLKSTLLSMVDIWSLRLANCRLACVVACSGGVVNTRSHSDECLSVGTAFLVAGAQHVVCTLWPVEQVSAVLVMSRFYLNLCKRSVEDTNHSWNIARCLAAAQSWYRTLTPAEYSIALEREKLSEIVSMNGGHRPDNRSIYNWAAFTVVGPPE
jgi:tetratricopeptide (TPR) repeat protein